MKKNLELLNDALITPPSKNIFALLDVGTARILCLIVKISSDGRMMVIGEGCSQSGGIRCGAIMNVREASECIMAALQQAEKTAKEQVDQVYVNVSDCGVSSQMASATSIGTNREITSRDIGKIIQQATKEVPNASIAVHAVPLNYSLDQIEGISNPLKMHGSDLHAEVNLVAALKSALLNLEHCLNQCSLNLKGCSLSSYSSGLTCLTEDERDVGSLIMDIGGGSTAIGVFKNNNIIHADCIPIGGIHVTYDIACAFNVRLSTAERMKNLYGSSLITSSEMNDFVDIEDETSSCGPKRIPLTTLSQVIRPRLEEIFELAHTKVTEFTLNNVVISGGGSQMANIRELAQLVMSTEVRIGALPTLEGISSKTLNGSYAGIIGLADIIAQSAHNNCSNRNYHYLRKLLSAFGKKHSAEDRSLRKTPV